MRLPMTIAIPLGLLSLAIGCDRAPVAPDSVAGSNAAAATAATPAPDTLDTASSSRAGRGDGPVIYVTSQMLYYDSIVTADPVPMKGPFQKLEVVDGRLQTEFGPGDRGYVGGRWSMDTNGNGRMDEGDRFFLCPLLGPGRESP